MIYFILYVLFVIICFINEWYILGSSLIILPIGFLISVIISAPKDEKKRLEQQKLEEELKAKQEEDLNTRIIPAYNQSRNDLINKYGNPVKSFILEKYNINKEIIAFEESKRI